MEHLCRVGLPAEFVEEQFIYNSMSKQSGKLSILQLQTYLKPHERNLEEWNALLVNQDGTKIMTDSEKTKNKKKDHYNNGWRTRDLDPLSKFIDDRLGASWDTAFFSILLLEILHEELAKIQDHINFQQSMKLQKTNRRQ